MEEEKGTGDEKEEKGFESAGTKEGQDNSGMKEESEAGGDAGTKKSGDDNAGRDIGGANGEKVEGEDDKADRDVTDEKEKSIGGAGGKVAEEVVKAADVNTMLLWFIDVLSYNAWIYLGLIPHPITKQVQKDLAQAKKAIDCVRFLLDQVEASPAEMARMRNLMTDLQMNFVEKSKETG